MICINLILGFIKITKLLCYLLDFDFFNLGTGKGSSVLEVVKTFEKVTGKPLNYKIAPRREGDIITAFADTKKAKKGLGWETKLNLEEALASSWKWQQNLRNT